MILYEFTCIDEFNLSEEEMISRLVGTLSVEANLQGWAEGYEIKRLPRYMLTNIGAKEWHFVVEGEYSPEGFDCA